MDSLDFAERHEAAMRLDAEIIGSLPANTLDIGAFLRVERAIQRFLSHVIDEQGLREALEAIKAKAVASTRRRAVAAKVRLSDLFAEHPVTIARSKVAARLEAEIIGTAPLNPYQPQPKGRAERVMAQYIRGAITRKELRARLTAIASEMREGRFAAIRVEAAKIRPRDLLAAVEEVRQRDQTTRLSAGLNRGEPQKNLATGPIGLTLPFGTTHRRYLCNDQLQNQITRDFGTSVCVTFNHVPLPSSTDDGSK